MQTEKPPMKASEARGRRQLGSGSLTSLPVYHQLYLVLGQRIREGEIPIGAQFPSELVLADQYDVSRVSVRRALALLEGEGLVERRRGAGTFVTPRGGEPARPLTGMVENLITIGLETDARLLSFGQDDAPPAYVTDALRLPAGTPLLRIERLRAHRREPFSLSALHVGPACAPLLDRANLSDKPVVALLEEAGLLAGSAEQTLSATLADDRSGELLEVPLGSALVRLRRVVHQVSGEPMLFQQSLYRPDRYEYHMLLTREKNAGRPRWRHIG